MVTFEKAYAVISMWIGEVTRGACEVEQVDDKPYGWVFYYRGKEIDEAVIFDRVSAEIVMLGERAEVDEAVERYESRLTKAQITLTPEPSNFVGDSAEFVESTDELE